MTKEEQKARQVEPIIWQMWIAIAFGGIISWGILHLVEKVRNPNVTCEVSDER